MMLEFISSLVPLQSKKLFLSFAFAQRSQGASARPTTELVANTKPAVVMIQTGDKPRSAHLADTGLFITPHWIATNSHVLRGGPKEEFQTNCHVLFSQGWILEHI
jgi:hypothetical protein